MDINTELGKEAENGFEKDFFQFLERPWKMLESTEVLKLVTTAKKRNQLVSYGFRNFVSNRNEKIKSKKNE